MRPSAAVLQPSQPLWLVNVQGGQSRTKGSRRWRDVLQRRKAVCALFVGPRIGCNAQPLLLFSAPTQLAAVALPPTPPTAPKLGQRSSPAPRCGDLSGPSAGSLPAALRSGSGARTTAADPIMGPSRSAPGGDCARGPLLFRLSGPYASAFRALLSASSTPRVGLGPRVRQSKMSAYRGLGWLPVPRDPRLAQQACGHRRPR